jgi:hypothetical protein
MKVARTREKAGEKKLGKIFDAVMALGETTTAQLGQLGEKLDELLAEGFPSKNRPAA